MRTSSAPPARDEESAGKALRESERNLPGTMKELVPREIDSIRAPCPVLVSPSLFIYAISRIARSRKDDTSYPPMICTQLSATYLLTIPPLTFK